MIMTSSISLWQCYFLCPPPFLSLALPLGFLQQYFVYSLNEYAYKKLCTQRRAGKQIGLSSSSCGTVFSFNELAIQALWGHFFQNQPSAENSGFVLLLSEQFQKICIVQNLKKYGFFDHYCMKYSPQFEAYGTLKPYFLRIIFIGMLVPSFIMTWAILVISHYKCVNSIYICYVAFPAVNNGN